MLNPKLTPSEHFTTTLLKVATALLLVAFLFAAAFSAGPDFAKAETTKRAVLGKGNMSLTPSCGRDFDRDCIAEGKVTGYQALSRRVEGRNFVVPFKGKVVSWSIALARATKKPIKIPGSIKPQPAQLPFFNEIFGTPSQARIAVLRQVEKRKKGNPRYRMVRQSPTQILNPYFGTTVHFALSKPLNVIKGQVIGLTIPTWVPALWQPRACDEVPGAGVVNDAAACDLAQEDYTWRGSRGPDYCSLAVTESGPNEALEKSRSQQKVGSDKRYGCYYGNQVLLYSATIVGQ